MKQAILIINIIVCCFMQNVFSQEMSFASTLSVGMPTQIEEKDIYQQIVYYGFRDILPDTGPITSNKDIVWLHGPLLTKPLWGQPLIVATSKCPAGFAYAFQNWSHNTYTDGYRSWGGFGNIFTLNTWDMQFEKRDFTLGKIYHIHTDIYDHYKYSCSPVASYWEAHDG